MGEGEEEEDVSKTLVLRTCPADITPTSAREFVLNVARTVPEFVTGELQETGLAREFCNDCGGAHAPGNVRRCKHLQEQRVVEAVAAKLSVLGLVPRIRLDPVLKVAT